MLTIALMRKYLVYLYRFYCVGLSHGSSQGAAAHFANTLLQNPSLSKAKQHDKKQEMWAEVSWPQVNDSVRTRIYHVPYV